jgi:hypothetical protein
MKKCLLVVALVALAAGATASAALANHSWNGYHWARSSNPFTLKVGDNLTTADWKSHYRQTLSDWSKSTVLDLAAVAGQTTKRCRPTSGRDEVCNGNYGQNGWLGLASIWLASGTKHITQGTEKMNDTYFAMARYNNAAEKEHVMCQEIGHTFGLDHQDESGASLNTCMDYYQNTSSTDTKSTTPNQHDYDELVTIYSHSDSTTTVGLASRLVPTGSTGTSTFVFPGRRLTRVDAVIWANPVHPLFY